MSSLVKQIRSEFQQFLDVVSEREMLIDSNPLVLKESSEGSWLSWASSSGLSYLFDDYASIDQYLQILNRRDFSFCMYDGGLLQVDYFFVNDEIVKHRLCFTPCPFGYKPSDWEGYSLSEIPSMMSAADLLKDARLASPIRFDFDADFSDEKHAYSHLTLNKSSCRVPAYGPVSLGHFFRFVLRYFYDDHLDSDAEISELRPRLYSRTLGQPRPHEMHIESSVGFE